MSILQEQQVVDICAGRGLPHPRKRHAWLVAAAAEVASAYEAAAQDSSQEAWGLPDVRLAVEHQKAAEEAIAERGPVVEKAEVVGDPDDPANSPAERALRGVLEARGVVELRNMQESTNRVAELFKAHATNLANHHHADRIALLDEGRRGELARAHEEALSPEWTPETPPFATAAHA